MGQGRLPERTGEEEREWVSQNGSKFVEDDRWKAIRCATELEFDAAELEEKSSGLNDTSFRDSAVCGGRVGTRGMGEVYTDWKYWRNNSALHASSEMNESFDLSVGMPVLTLSLLLASLKKALESLRSSSWERRSRRTALESCLVSLGASCSLEGWFVRRLTKERRGDFGVRCCRIGVK